MHRRCQFVDDLIPLILEADEHWWPCHLALLATVSSAWLFYARKRLYACPDIRSNSAAKKLAETLGEDEYLASLVNAISLQPAVLQPYERRVPLNLKAIRTLLALDSVRRITLGGDMVMGAERYIRLIANPEIIEEIHVNGPPSCLYPKIVEWDESFTFGFPNLKKLRLTNVDLTIMPPTIRYPASFTHLILEDVVFLHGNMLQLLNGTSALSCLHVTSPVGEDELRLVLSSCAVDCLHYDINMSGTTNVFSGLDADGGENVRCLHLDGHFLDNGILDTLNDVFRKLEELVVTGRLVRVLAGEWTEFLRSGRLCSLRRLGLPWGTNKPPFTLWQEEEMEEIRRVCHSRSIILI